MPVENARASTLRDAVTHAVETDREFKQKSSVMSGDKRGKALSMTTFALLAVSIYSWIAKPPVIWGAPVRPQAPEVQHAHLRMSMFLFGMKVDRYRAKNGAYPETLAEMGDSIRGISYARVNDSTFQLSGRAANREIVFRSDMRAPEFLGNTREIIQSRPRR